MDKKYDFTFIDLFAGLGGIRLSFENAFNLSLHDAIYNDNKKKLCDFYYKD